MKILISAYACDPYLGSEPGVGWTAVCRIAEHHDVWVMTHSRHRENWEKARNEGRVPSNVSVRFFCRNRPWIENRLIAHFQSWLSFAAFNRKVLDHARAWHDEVGFDLCHHVTIATWRIGSPLWRLPAPFIWGPIGGGGHIPMEFRAMLSPLSRLFEKIRDVNTWLALRSGKFRDCIRGAAVVFAANEETELLLQPHRDGRTMVRLPIASIPKEKEEAFRRPEGVVNRGPIRLFAGGNMEGRKGVSLALKALAKVAEAGVDFHYTVAGGGPEIESLKELARQLGIEGRVEFHDGFSGQDYISRLHTTDLYFLPSFRESTPVTLLEAYLAGCYPVVADTSAQGEIVRLAGGTAVPATTMEELIDGLADAVIDCATHRDELPAKVSASRQHLMDYFNSRRYDDVISDAYRDAMNAPKPTQT